MSGLLKLFLAFKFKVSIRLCYFSAVELKRHIGFSFCHGHFSKKVCFKGEIGKGGLILNF